MQSPLQSPTASTDPKSVKVNLTTGTGIDIEWNDGHVSHYTSCTCAMLVRARCARRTGKNGAASRRSRHRRTGGVADLQADCKASFRRRRGQVRHQVLLERQPRSGDVLVEVSARNLSVEEAGRRMYLGGAYNWLSEGCRTLHEFRHDSQINRCSISCNRDGGGPPCQGGCDKSA